MSYFSTKTFGHEVGLSCAFRQPKALHSHCHLLHGYALSFKFVFGCTNLDDKNWVVDFGALKHLKERLAYYFDHTVAVDVSDHAINWFRTADAQGVLLMREFPNGVGCERFAEFAFHQAREFLIKHCLEDRVWVESCECAEHGANSAIYTRNIP